MNKVIKDIIKLIQNADNNMILDNVKYKSPREYTIALIKNYESLNRDTSI